MRVGSIPQCEGLRAYCDGGKVGTADEVFVYNQSISIRGNNNE
jgi:hypothetical protein